MNQVKAENNEKKQNRTAYKALVGTESQSVRQKTSSKNKNVKKAGNKAQVYKDNGPGVGLLHKTPVTLGQERQKFAKAEVKKKLEEGRIKTNGPKKTPGEARRQKEQAEAFRFERQAAAQRVQEENAELMGTTGPVMVMPIPKILVTHEMQVKKLDSVTRVRRLSTALKAEFEKRNRHCSGGCLVFLLLVGLAGAVLVTQGYVKI
jgi:hypothetical protein